MYVCGVHNLSGISAQETATNRRLYGVKKNFVTFNAAIVMLPWTCHV